MMMGTPAYMAPEQVQGARDADPRSDVWALGVMMFELIAGRMPFDMQDAPALFVAIATRDAPSLLEVGAEVTPAISRLVSRCLRRLPDERYPSAAELGRDLRHVLDNTELEPTGQRSIPPGLLNRVPELSIPKAGRVPVVDSNASPTLRGHGEAPAADDEEVDPKGATSLGYATPEAPSLFPPAPRSATAASPRAAPPAPGPASAKRAPTPEAPDLAATSRPAPAAKSVKPSRVAPEASLPGVMLSGSSSTSPRGPAHGTHGMYVERPTREVADMRPLIALAVVGLVAILGTGLLMQLVHRPEGWPIARFVVGPSSTGILAIQGGLALVALVIGGSYVSARHPSLARRYLSGGHPSAIVCAAVAAGAFFAAIELLSAAY